MQSWTGFYSLIGTAVATLIGLLFVALSLNAGAALKTGPEGSRRIAEQAFENYLAVLMVALLAAFPAIDLKSFGRIILLVTASWTVWVLVRLYQAAAETSLHESRLTALRRHVPTMIGFGLLILSAGRMGWAGDDMRQTMASAVIVLLFSATERAWTLLNRMAATRSHDERPD